MMFLLFFPVDNDFLTFKKYCINHARAGNARTPDNYREIPKNPQTFLYHGKDFSVLFSGFNITCPMEQKNLEQKN